MKISIVAFAFLLSGISNATSISAQQIFTLYKVSPGQTPVITTEDSSLDPGQSCTDVFFTNIAFNGKYTEKQMGILNEDFQIVLSFETLDPAERTNIITQIQANYAAKGLPACLLHDHFSADSYVIDYQNKIVTRGLEFVPAVMCGSMQVGVPVTSCADVQNLYP